MLFPDAATLAAKNSLATEITAGKVVPEEGLRKFLEIDPLDPVALLGLGVIHHQQGRLDEAAQFFWRAAEADPCRWDPYVALAALGKDDARPSPLTAAVLALGFRKVLANEKRYREQIREPEDGPPLTRQDMEELVALSAQLQTTEPQSVTDRLRPHRLIHELHYPPAAAVRPEVVEQILEYRDLCQPLLVGTLRGWSLGSLRDEDDFPAEAAVALLGEIGDLATLPALLEFLDVDEDGIREAAAWAVWRLAERNPREVLPRLRQAAAGGPSSLRWGLAPAYGMMRGIEGVQEALLELLHGLEDLDPVQRGAVFCAVTWALQESQGRPARALVLALIARYQKILDQETQRDCLLPADEEESLPPLSVYDFCCEPLDDEEEEEPVFVRPKIGRNDPCWCGSGKKYKKCHLGADDQREREAATKDQTILEQVLTFMEQELREDEMRAAIKTFFGDVKEVDEDDQVSFMDWMVHDYPVRRFGRTLFEEFLVRRADRLTPEMKRLAETHARSTFHLLEVQDVKPGSGIQVRDLLQGGDFFAHDVSASRRSSRWDTIFSRVLDFGPRQELSGAYLLLPRSLCPRLREWATADREKKGGDWPAYLRTNGHRLRRHILALHKEWTSSIQMSTSEGDPLVFSKAVYEVLDEAAFRRAAESSPVHACDEEGDFAWFEAPATTDDEPRRVLGHLRFQGGRVLLECQSRQRLERGRALLASLAPGSLKHLGDEFTDWRQAMEQSRSRPSGPPADSLPPEAERQLLEDFYTRHYARWPDTPLPALGGRTPRDAVRTPDGREKVITLLKDFENGNERARRAGRYAHDLSGLKAELGIDSL